MADTDLDDGDMARLLARTADMLKQVCWVQRVAGRGATLLAHPLQHYVCWGLWIGRGSV